MRCDVDRYYEGGISSVYLWDVEGGFAGVVLLKKGQSSILFPASLIHSPSCDHSQQLDVDGSILGLGYVVLRSRAREILTRFPQCTYSKRRNAAEQPPTSSLPPS